MSETTLDTPETQATEALIDKFQETMTRIRTELGKVIVGQDQVLEQLLITVLVGGHCLITGLPGTAKTLMVQSLADALVERQQVHAVSGRQRLQEASRCLARRRRRPVAGDALAEIQHQRHVHRHANRIQDQEHRLLLAVLEHAEVIGRQPRNRLTFIVDDRHLDAGHLDFRVKDRTLRLLLGRLLGPSQWTQQRHAGQQHNEGQLGISGGQHGNQYEQWSQLHVVEVHFRCSGGK